MAMDMRSWLIHVYDLMAPKIAEMRTIWNEIGRTTESQDDEIYEMMTSFEHLSLCIISRKLQQLIEDRHKLLNEAESYLNQVILLTRTLDLPNLEPDENLNMLQVLDFLKNRVVNLEKIRDERLAILNKLSDQEKDLVEQLGESCTNNMQDLTLKTLDSMRHRVQCLEEEKKSRFETFFAKKTTIAHLMNELERVPETTFVRDILCQNETDCNLTKNNLNAMASLEEKLENKVQKNEAEGKKLRESLHLLWNALQVETNVQHTFLQKHFRNNPSTLTALKQEVDRCRQLKMKNAKQYVHNVRQQISNMWDRCFICLKYQKAFKPFYADEITDEILKAHDSELERLTNLYTDAQELFTKFEKRASLWERMLQFEKPESDSCRFKNRGGRLLKEEKERKKLMILIPKLETELEALVAKRDLEHAPPVLINGKNIMDYIRDQWDNYQQEKENEKQKRHDEKAKLLETEAMNGSKANTTKRRLMATPTREPRNKCRKLLGPLSPNVMSAKSNVVPVLGKPPQCGAKVTPAVKTKVLPRRLVGQRNRRNETRTTPDIFAVDDSIVAQQLHVPSNVSSSTMNLTTSSHFMVNLNQKCNDDVHSRSSAVTPRSPGTPRRYRDKLGLPFLL